MNLELRLEHLVHSYGIWHSAAHMAIPPITAYFYQLFSLWVVIFLRLLLVLNQIQIQLHSKDYIHMNECIGERAIDVWINSTWQHLSTIREALGFIY